MEQRWRCDGQAMEMLPWMSEGKSMDLAFFFGIILQRK